MEKPKSILSSAPPVNDPSFRHQCVWNHNLAYIDLRLAQVQADMMLAANVLLLVIGASATGCDIDSAGDAVIVAGASDSCVLPMETIVDKYCCLDEDHSSVAWRAQAHKFEVLTTYYLLLSTYYLLRSFCS